MVLTLKIIFQSFLHFDKEELKGGKAFHAVSTTKHVFERQNRI